MDDYNKVFSERLKKKKNENNLSSKEIFLKTGINTGNLSRFENGKLLPSAQTLILLSEVLNCSTDYLLKGKEHEEKEIYQEFTEEERKLILKMRALKESDIDFIKDMINTRYEKTIKERQEKFSNPNESTRSGENIA